MLEHIKNIFSSPPKTAEPLGDYEFSALQTSHAYDHILPPLVSAKESIVQGEFSTIHKVALVEKSAPMEQLGYMVLQHVYSDARWWKYMEDHELKDLWIDRADMISLAPHRGIGSTLWNISHKVIRSGESRAIIDTSDGWTRRKINEAQKDGIFQVQESDSVANYGKSYKRYLVNYK